MAFSYSLSTRRIINAYLTQSTLGNVLIWITDSSGIRRHVDWKLYQSNIQYTRTLESSIIINTALRTSNLAAYWYVSLLISRVKQGRLFYPRTRILSSVRRCFVMADSAELCVVTLYLKSVSAHFCSKYSVKHFCIYTVHLTRSLNCQTNTCTSSISID